MKKSFLIFITLMIFYIFPENILAQNYCSAYDNSPDKCENNTYCDWIIYNEGAGDGYCKLKSEFKACNQFTTQESCPNTYCEWGTVSGCQDHIQNRSISCQYEVDTTNQNIEGNSVKCQFTVTVDANKKIGISWKNLYTNKTGILNDNQISFDCSGKSINFWNSQLPDAESKLEQTTTVNGKEIARYDFNEKFKELSNGNRVCPKIKAAQAIGNYYVVFTDTLAPEEFIYNTGGTQNTIPGGDNIDIPDIPDDDKDNYISNCETIPKVITEYIEQALRVIRWIGLVLMIILGVLDFTKAVASDDQEAVKKAWQKVIKRLIAVIILFLLPMLVELILDLVNLNNGCKIET